MTADVTPPRRSEQCDPRSQPCTGWIEAAVSPCRPRKAPILIQFTCPGASLVLRPSTRRKGAAEEAARELCRDTARWCCLVRIRPAWQRSSVNGGRPTNAHPLPQRHSQRTVGTIEARVSVLRLCAHEWPCPSVLVNRCRISCHRSGPPTTESRLRATRPPA
jgi:hypothetical protein